MSSQADELGITDRITTGRRLARAWAAIIPQRGGVFRTASAASPAQPCFKTADELAQKCRIVCGPSAARSRMGEVAGPIPARSTNGINNLMKFENISGVESTRGSPDGT
jgi:hypothetical protein